MRKDGWYCVNIPIYFGKLWVKYSEDFEKDAKLIGVTLREGANEHLAITFKKDSKGPSEYVIMIGKHDASVIAHEALHAVNFILNDVHIELSITNDEPQCYLLGWVVSQVELAKKKT